MHIFLIDQTPCQCGRELNDDLTGTTIYYDDLTVHFWDRMIPEMEIIPAIC